MVNGLFTLIYISETRNEGMSFNTYASPKETCHRPITFETDTDTSSIICIMIKNMLKKKQ